MDDLLVNEDSFLEKEINVTDTFVFTDFSVDNYENITMKFEKMLKVDKKPSVVHIDITGNRSV